MAAFDVDLHEVMRFGEQVPRERRLESEPSRELGRGRGAICTQEPLERKLAGLMRILLAPARPVGKADERGATALPRSVANTPQRCRPADRQRPVRIVAGPGLIAGRGPLADAGLELPLQGGPVDRFRADGLGDGVDEAVEIRNVDAEPGVALPL